MLTKTMWIALLATAATAIACMRPVADRRAVQWSDSIVHAKLISVIDSANEIYNFNITGSLDGPLTPSQTITVHGSAIPGDLHPCPNQPTADDAGKNFLLLLRSAGKDSYTIVNISPTDAADVTSVDAMKELIQTTRKAEAALTDETIKTQALAYANAQDDTEADQAEEALNEMGYKALPVIRQVLSTLTTDIGKQRLATLIKDLTPPGETPSTTQP